MENVLEIRMQRNDVECTLCGELTDLSHGIPTYNGDIVSNAFPDDLWHDGGGSIPVCGKCYVMHERGWIPTMDELYIPRDGFIGGAGI